MFRKLAFAILLLSFYGSSPAVNPQAGGAKDDAWNTFWKSVNVDPAPPRDFLEGEFTGKILNLTEHRVDDATAKAWILADRYRTLFRTRDAGGVVVPEEWLYLHPG